MSENKKPTFSFFVLFGSFVVKNMRFRMDTRH